MRLDWKLDIHPAGEFLHRTALSGGNVVVFSGILAVIVEFSRNDLAGFPVAPLGVAKVGSAHGITHRLGHALVIGRARMLRVGSSLNGRRRIFQHRQEALALKVLRLGQARSCRCRK